jgi:lipoprotein-releasing system permease protein
MLKLLDPRHLVRTCWRLGHASSRHYIFFLTMRYLVRRPLAVVAIVALALAVIALVLAPSVMNGFQAEFHGRVRGTLSDLRLWSEQPFAVKRDADVESRLESIPGVVAVAPYLETPALDKHRSKIDYCFLQGIEPRKEEKVSDLAKYLLSERDMFFKMMDRDVASASEKAEIDKAAEGMKTVPERDEIYKLLEEGDPERPDLPTCLVGIYYFKTYEFDITALRQTKKSIGTIHLTTSSDDAQVKQDREVLVVGTFATGFFNNDRRFIYMGLKNSQQMVGADQRVSGYSLKLEDYEKAAEVKEPITKIAFGAARDKKFPSRFLLRTWEEKDENLLRAVRMEKLLIRIITALIVAAASTSIFLVLIMTVFMKVRELGILRAVGGSRFGVFTLFLGQGLLIASLAMGLGCLAGVGLSNYINQAANIVHKLTGFHPFPPDVYYLNEIPTKIIPRELAEDFGITLALAAVFGLIPAFIAALRPPIRAIRYE